MGDGGQLAGDDRRRAGVARLFGELDPMPSRRPAQQAVAAADAGSVQLRTRWLNADSGAGAATTILPASQLNGTIVGQQRLEIEGRPDARKGRGRFGLEVGTRGSEGRASNSRW
jgi:hypothetical protein